MSSKGGGTVYVPAQITTAVKGVWVNAAKGYAGPISKHGTELNIDQFIETVRIEPELPNQDNVGHPNYKPFMLRRYGENQVNLAASNLAYDTVTGKWQAYLQLQESLRIMATGELTLIDTFSIGVGDTIAFDDMSMGVRNLFLIEGMEESPQGVKLTLIDVLGG